MTTRDAIVSELLDGVRRAKDVLLDLAEDPSIDPRIRKEAATEYMDRAGFGPGATLTIEANHNHRVDPTLLSMTPAQLRALRSGTGNVLTIEENREPTDEEGG